MWKRCGKLIRGAFRYTGERKWRDAVLHDPGLAPAPFDCSDKLFVHVFREVISREKFQTLRSDDCDAPFIPSRIGRMRQFWRDLHDAYIRDDRRRGTLHEPPE